MESGQESRRKLADFLVLLALTTVLPACGGGVSNLVLDSQPPPNPLTFTIDSLPNATVAQAYSVSLTATGGTPPYSWSLSPDSGALPTGLSLNSGGAISGVPTNSGDFPVDISVKDSANPAITASRKFVITVLPPPSTLSITTASLPEASTGREYSTYLAATGGTSPYMWQLAPGSGNLPAGLYVARSGAIAGVTAESGSFSITVKVIDAALPEARTAIKDLVLTTDAKTLTVTTVALPGGTASQSYAASLNATGGTPPYTWRMSPQSNSLPSGLSLEPGGNVSGTPSQAGPFIFTVQVTDSNEATAVGGVNLNVASAASTTYYVDAGGGDDNNSGTDPATAWKTLAKVSTARFSSGDQVLLKRGEVWHEQLTVPSSGTAGDPIYFGAFGSGESPVIDGADLVSSWNVRSGSIYSASVAWAPLHVWEDGSLLKQAPSLLAITSAGEWFYDSGSSQLYVWSTGHDSLSNHTIEADRRSHTIEVASKSYITISDLTLVNSTSYLIEVYNSQNAAVLNCKLRNSPAKAVDVSKASANFLIDHSSYVVDSGYAGTAFVSVHSIDADSPTVSNNTVGDFGGTFGIAMTDINNAQVYGNTIVGNGVAIAILARSRTVTGAQVHHNFAAVCDTNEGEGECVEFSGNMSPLYTVSGSINQNFVLGGPNTFGGIDAWHAINSAIYNNVVLNTNNSGMHWTSGCTGNLFYNNTIVNTPVTGIAIYTNSSGQIVNTIIVNATVGIATENTSNVTEDYNLMHSVSLARSNTIGAGSHTILEDPLFVSTSVQGSGDVRLQPGSPAVDSGQNLGSPYNSALDPKSGSWPYATTDQNASGSGWERGAFAFR